MAVRTVSKKSASSSPTNIKLSNGEHYLESTLLAVGRALLVILITLFVVPSVLLHHEPIKFAQKDGGSPFAKWFSQIGRTTSLHKLILNAISKDGGHGFSSYNFSVVQHFSLEGLYNAWQVFLFRTIEVLLESTVLIALFAVTWAVAAKKTPFLRLLQGWISGLAFVPIFYIGAVLFGANIVKYL